MTSIVKYIKCGNKPKAHKFRIYERLLLGSLGAVLSGGELGGLRLVLRVVRSGGGHVGEREGHRVLERRVRVVVQEEELQVAPLGPRVRQQRPPRRRRPCARPLHGARVGRRARKRDAQRRQEMRMRHVEQKRRVVQQHRHLIRVCALCIKQRTLKAMLYSRVVCRLYQQFTLLYCIFDVYIVT